MSEKVRAAVTVASGQIAIQEFDMPSLGKGAAICKVLMAGVCGTDKHTYSGETVQYKGTPDEFSIPFPIIQGHELVMEIVAIDEEGARNLSFDGDYLQSRRLCHYLSGCGMRNNAGTAKNIPSYPWCEKSAVSLWTQPLQQLRKTPLRRISQYMYIEPSRL